MLALLRRPFLFLITVLFLLASVPVSAHDMGMGGSRWCFGKNYIVATIDLGPSLLSQIPGIKEGQYNLDSLSDEQLRQMSADIVQPYINKKVSITVNDTAYPVKVNKIVKENSLWQIWLSVDNVSFNNPATPVRIEYRLLFEETNSTHMNIAYMYLSDAAADAVQKIFDFSQPASQNTFDHNAPAWELSIQGTAASNGPNDIKDGKSITVNQKDISGTRVTDKKLNISSASQKASAISKSVPGKRSPDNHIAVKKNDIVPNKPAKKSAWSNIGEFILLGIEHILTGYDHIAFLLALIVIGLSIKEVLNIITAFTVAHSITLLLAALQIVSLNSRLVESVIAFSICYVALENLFKNKADYRWLVTFGFGLVHGFGFASALQELIVGKSNLLVSVVSFNMGVELGQIIIFLVMLPVLHLLKNKIEFRKVTIATSLAIFLLGFTWLIERGFNLKLLPI